MTDYKPGMTMKGKLSKIAYREGKIALFMHDLRRPRWMRFLSKSTDFQHYETKHYYTISGYDCLVTFTVVIMNKFPTQGTNWIGELDGKEIEFKVGSVSGGELGYAFEVYPDSTSIKILP